MNFPFALSLWNLNSAASGKENSRLQQIRDNILSLWVPINLFLIIDINCKNRKWIVMSLTGIYPIDSVSSRIVWFTVCMLVTIKNLTDLLWNIVTSLCIEAHTYIVKFALIERPCDWAALLSCSISLFFSLSFCSLLVARRSCLILD